MKTQEAPDSLRANVEIKAKVKNFARLKWLAGQISETPVEVLEQEDTFFFSPNGRLKLRVFASGNAEIIYYSRNDVGAPKQSSYVISETPNHESLKAALSLSLGVMGVVRKRRFLYIVNQTRIHLDEVEGLGEFVELEYVLRPTQTQEQGVRAVQELMKQLEISSDDLIEGAYIDKLFDQSMAKRQAQSA